VGVTREQMAAFFFWCGLAWYLKPFAGILTDAFPLLRTRRRHYLLISYNCAVYGITVRRTLSLGTFHCRSCWSLRIGTILKPLAIPIVLKREERSISSNTAE
jgi:hypothetical protein